MDLVWIDLGWIAAVATVSGYHIALSIHAVNIATNPKIGKKLYAMYFIVTNSIRLGNTE